ncbi:type II secretion system protein J [Pontiella sp.]|uniref:PulJ/GspJ family protein n=2 Tax=Pontiella sp. TaxID=2837462 RepID=UPI003565714D
MAKTSRKQGLSLVELLVAMTAVAILALTVGALLTLPIRTITGNDELVRLKNDMGIAMTYIAADVRESEYNEVVAYYGDGILTLPANPVRSSVIQYQLEGDALNRYVDGSGPTAVIPEGVDAFRSWPTNDTSSGIQGIGLHIEITSGGGVPLDHDSFIHTRN